MLSKNIPSDRKGRDAMDSALLEAFPDAVFVMDPKGVILNSNTLFASGLGRQPHECIDESIYELVASVLQLPELADYLREKSEEVLLRRSRVVFAAERDVRKVTISPVLSAEGEISRLLVTIQNISEQKRIDRELNKERALKTMLLDAMPCSAIILDSDLRMVVSNQYAQNMLFGSAENGQAPVDPVEFFSPDDKVLLREKLRNTLDTGVEDYSEIQVYPHRSTHPLWMMTRTTPIPDLTSSVHRFASPIPRYRNEMRPMHNCTFSCSR